MRGLQSRGGLFAVRTRVEHGGIGRICFASKYESGGRQTSMRSMLVMYLT